LNFFGTRIQVLLNAAAEGLTVLLADVASREQGGIPRQTASQEV
jgi:hypothetical protein